MFMMSQATAFAAMIERAIIKEHVNERTSGPSIISLATSVNKSDLLEWHSNLRKPLSEALNKKPGSLKLRALKHLSDTH